MLLPGALALILFHPGWQGQDRLLPTAEAALGQSLVLGPLLLVKIIVGIPVESSSAESASVQSWFPLPSFSPCAVLLGVQPSLDPAPALAAGGAGVALW